MRIGKSSVLIICSILFTITCLICLLFYSHLQSKDNDQIYQSAVEETHVTAEGIVVDYDDLDPVIKASLEERISRGIANSYNKAVTILCNKYRINDDMEKNLIWGNPDVGRLFDSYSEKKSILSICLIKPNRTSKSAKKIRISNSFLFNFPNSDMKMEYKCLEADIVTPIALIRAIQIQENGTSNSIDMILYYTRQSGWKKLEMEEREKNGKE